ncbi:hypothetical protein [Colwellia sp. 12G3]|uniref:hypothetical protein n=1 Tax=Colwellia sp. 12G3 TaxID=2058299 RepID=UPI000C33CC75|nr:hypothetical protein [Colwellia sp. 12G3]PKI16712.1 hypothetical protein CXF71_07920 [Colwellia sp. 12G3]
MKTFLITLVAIFIMPSAYAKSPPQWLYNAIKVSNPNELAYFVQVSDSCPFTSDEINEITEGVLIRSRIKPLKDDIFVSGRIYLNLGISCVKLDGSSQVFAIKSAFGRYEPTPAIIYDYPFGFNGIGPKEYILTNFKSSTERAITAFVKSNFNL